MNFYDYLKMAYFQRNPKIARREFLETFEDWRNGLDIHEEKYRLEHENYKFVTEKI